MFDPRYALLGDAGPTQDQITAFRAFARMARAQAASGDPGAQQSYWNADAAFVAMGSPPAYKDELDYAYAAVYGGSGTEGAGSVGAVQDVQSSAALLARGRVNARPSSVTDSFFSGFSQSVDDALSSLGSVAPFVKWGVFGLLALKLAQAASRTLGVTR